LKTKNSQQINVDISYHNKHITNISNTKFLGPIVDETLLWKSHIDKIMSKLSCVCYAVRSVTVVTSQETLRSYLSSHHYLIPKCIVQFRIIFSYQNGMLNKRFKQSVSPAHLLLTATIRRCPT